MQSACYWDTVIISDLHLGSDVSRAREALNFLRTRRFKRLILLGDIFSDLNFRRLTKEHWQFLSQIRKLSNPKRNVEVVWVEGNHDQGLSQLMSHLVGVPVYQQYAWEFNGIRHMAVHGHQFDRFVVNNIFLSRFGEFFYLLIQKYGDKDKTIARYLDRLNTRWLRLSTKVAKGALAFAKQSGAERIFCGHTHVALTAEQDGVSYFNSGSWIDKQCTYITIDSEGAQIHVYADGIDHSDPNEERELVTASPFGFLGEPGLRGDAAYQSIRC